jgi:hypothetical protein
MNESSVLLLSRNCVDCRSQFSDISSRICATLLALLQCINAVDILLLGLNVWKRRAVREPWRHIYDGGEWSRHGADEESDGDG